SVFSYDNSEQYGGSLNNEYCESCGNQSIDSRSDLQGEESESSLDNFQVHPKELCGQNRQNVCGQNRQDVRRQDTPDGQQTPTAVEQENQLYPSIDVFLIQTLSSTHCDTALTLRLGDIDLSMTEKRF
ncbi:hypothetical protein BgiBS90_022926, partial [Biomphalaria glabrata]